jgi:hypothetical protein
MRLCSKFVFFGIDLISQDLTKEILNTLKPELIMSGDDHDDCELTLSNALLLNHLIK